MPLNTACPFGNVPGSGMGMGQGVGQNAGLHMGMGAGKGLHLGVGGGMLSCPAGPGLLPGLQAQGGAAKGIVAALGANGTMTQSSSVAAKTAMAATVGAGGKGLSLGLGIGLGLWGPALLAAASAAGAVYFWRRFQENNVQTDDEAEMAEAISAR